MSVPRLIGRYEVVKRIGMGGMGLVYLARDPVIDRLVALKMLQEEAEDLRERFRREVRAAGRLRHVNIVTVFDVGEHDGQLFMAMEYVAGQTLSDLIRARPPLPLARRLELLEALCAGLGYAHRAGIVHRDIKPGNLMVDADGVLKILDFGIVRVADSSMTIQGMVMGTPNYMSPEQMTGQAVDHRTDIFSTGAVMYEFLTGAAAFPGSLGDGVLYRILQSTPAPPSSLNPELVPELDRIVARAIEKDPAARYQDLADMRRELSQVRLQLVDDPSEQPTVLHDPALARPLTPPAAPPPATPMTPPNRRAGTQIPTTPRRGPDRELLARRRQAQIRTNLDAAREAYAQGEFELCLDYCEQAATLDPDNVEALDLMDRAREALEERELAAVVSRAEGLLASGDLDGAEGALHEVLQRPVSFAPAEALAGRIDERRRAEREAREQAEREAREQAEREAREQAERQARERAEREARERAEREAREQAEREAREQAEREAREQAEREAREQAEREAREQAEREAREQAEREARERAEREAREQAEREAREQAEREAREQAEREAREQAEREAREQAEREAREQAEREAREQAKREARERAEREARERAERARAERAAREQAEREAREQAEREAREQAEHERAERAAREQAEREARERAKREARERAEREARQRAERARAERAAREQAEREAREQEQRERAERAARERAEREERAAEDAAAAMLAASSSTSAPAPRRLLSPAGLAVAAAVVVALAVFTWLVMGRTAPPATTAGAPAPSRAPAGGAARGAASAPPTPTAEQPGTAPAPSGGTVSSDAAAAPSAADRRAALDRVRRLLTRGDRSAALSALTAVLEQGDDREAQQLLRQVASGARLEAVRAQQAGLSRGVEASEDYRTGTRRLQEAERLFKAGRLDAAARSAWEAESSFRTAARSAPARGDRAAAEPPVPPTQPEAPPSRPPQTGSVTGTEIAKPVAAAPITPAAPPPAPVQPSQETPRATAAPANDDAAVRTLVRRYLAAQERRDIGEMRRLWPTMPGARATQMARDFAGLRVYQLAVQSTEVALQGNRATVACRVAQTFQLHVGNPSTVNAAFYFQVAKSGDAWVVTDVDRR